MLNIGSEYRLFHTTRIINILLNQQTPCNDHGDNKTSDCGCFRIKTDTGKAKEINASLFEMGMIGEQQHKLIEKVLCMKETDLKTINSINDVNVGLSALFDD